MRALCGAIITAGALIGLGLAAVGIGQRYSSHAPFVEGQPLVAHISQLDSPMLYVLAFLSLAAMVGLGVTFVGLSYHHHRREREHELHRQQTSRQGTGGIVVP